MHLYCYDSRLFAFMPSMSCYIIQPEQPLAPIQCYSLGKLKRKPLHSAATLTDKSCDPRAHESVQRPVYMPSSCACCPTSPKALASPSIVPGKVWTLTTTRMKLPFAPGA